ncbi:glycosyltransferase family 2 protein [Adhaeribacter swui]|uniref:Glycosyltransferase family 2 protein n=1 Tax=Adhaeribacter swui TaxID=2086471 RepID=A0A7G7G5B5_9BACT|nr:glycosyltransferase family 2 protein [Adhaeribacter swui]QNF32349.1 glycosyltransferase family 2 protein [Adhaeribacter swui]
MHILEPVLNILLYIIGAYALFNVSYLLFFSLAGHKSIRQNTRTALTARRMCVLFPAYKEDAVIIESALKAKAHAYNGLFDVCVIADKLKPETIDTLTKNGIKVIEVNFEKSTKGKALLTALNHLPESNYDVAVVLDADNHMGKDFLKEINLAFESGFKVVQAHRTAKNLDTAFAFLDACNEEINNHIFRKGHYALGLSSALIGSGMAFEFSYLKNLLTNIGETVGEDKEIDFRIARDQVKICYLDKVYVYDEKIDNAAVFTQQRTRWIASQLEFLKKYFWQGFVQLFKHGNVEFFNKMVQAMLVPRILLLGLLGLLFMLSLVVPYGPSVGFWAILLGMISTALFIGVPGRLYNKQLFEALLRIPYAFFCMCLAVLNTKKTKTSFLATPHKTKVVSADLDK